MLDDVAEKLKPEVEAARNAHDQDALARRLALSPRTTPHLLPPHLSHEAPSSVLIQRRLSTSLIG
jgi:hypothetical protein